MHLGVNNLILTVIVLNQVLGSSEAINCYSASQGVCTAAISKLWDAYYHKQHAGICRYFDELNTCTMNYAARCKFDQYDMGLYNKDIVQTFTKDPYRCSTIGGNMMLGSDEQRSTAAYNGQHSVAISCGVIVLTILCSN